MAKLYFWDWIPYAHMGGQLPTTTIFEVSENVFFHQCISSPNNFGVKVVQGHTGHPVSYNIDIILEW